MYQNILVPIDGSGISKLSMEELEKVSENGSNIHFISIVDYSIFGENLDADDEQKALKDEREAGEALKNIIEDLEEDYNIKTEVVKGWPAASIADYADKHEIDLIIMSTHGNKHMDKSVTHKLIDATEIPVLVKGKR